MTRKKIRYGVIGGGFRAEFYLRIAAELPELFEVCGQVTNVPEKTAKWRGLLGAKLYKSAEELTQKEAPQFLVVSTRRPPQVEREPMIDLVKLGVPLLMETPAARDMDGLKRIYELCHDKKVQVAEQLHAQPENAARLSLAASGKLGRITQLEAAFHHTYHCFNVVRKFLGLGFENAEILARQYAFPVVQGFTRSGISESEKIVEEKRDIALLDFGGRLVLYNYENAQIRSFVRSEHLCVRGERGEINDRTIRWLVNHRDSRTFTYERLYGGAQSNLEGFHFRGLMGGGEWIYRNPYPYTPLADEDIAIAVVLEKMALYVEEGKSFCGMADACQDQYLSLMMEKAAEEKKPLVTETQVWAKGN